MATEIQIKRYTGSGWVDINPITSINEVSGLLDGTGKVTKSILPKIEDKDLGAILNTTETGGNGKFKIQYLPEFIFSGIELVGNITGTSKTMDALFVAALQKAAENMGLTPDDVDPEGNGISKDQLGLQILQNLKNGLLYNGQGYSGEAASEQLNNTFFQYLKGNLYITSAVTSKINVGVTPEQYPTFHYRALTQDGSIIGDEPGEAETNVELESMDWLVITGVEAAYSSGGSGEPVSYIPQVVAVNNSIDIATSNTHGMVKVSSTVNSSNDATLVPNVGAVRNYTQSLINMRYTSTTDSNVKNPQDGDIMFVTVQ